MRYNLVDGNVYCVRMNKLSYVRHHNINGEREQIVNDNSYLARFQFENLDHSPFPLLLMLIFLIYTSTV